MRKAFFAVAALVLTAGVARAAPYGDAGCGLGSLAFKDQKGMIQVVAATLNGTGFQTFAITSGTSNCGDSGVGKVGTKTFIEGNREALAKDAARGSGETIDTLTVLAGCRDSKAVGSALQKQFSELFPSQSTPVEQVSAKVISTLQADPSLACSSIG